MRVSEHFNLGRTQPTLDFVDVDVVGDTRLFVDPKALTYLDTAWSNECIALVQDFFETVLRSIASGNILAARELLVELREPNETHLGLSRGRAQGRSLGKKSSERFGDALAKSIAVQTGLVEDLEDTLVLVEGVGPDIVSDITTVVIREALVNYTETACSYYGIPLEPEVDSGPMWDPSKKQWHVRFARLPVAMGNKLLLVPKILVRSHMHYNADDYYNTYMLSELRRIELDKMSSLVRTLKNGVREVTKADLRRKYGSGKRAAVEQTLLHPEVYTRYRRDRRGHLARPLDHEQFSDYVDAPEPDWDELLSAVQRVQPGRNGATAYHSAAEALLSALFYPTLTLGQKEFPIHAGRKRIDIGPHASRGSRTSPHSPHCVCAFSSFGPA